MLHSPILIDQQSHFYFENYGSNSSSSNNHSSNWPFARSRIMHSKDNIHGGRRSPVTTYVTPATPVGESPAVHHGYEPATPRTYNSHSAGPSSGPVVPTAGSPHHPEGQEMQPWMFQLFPDPYAETQSYPAPAENQYMPPVVEGPLLYGQTAPSSLRPHVSHTYGERLHDGEHAAPPPPSLSPSLPPLTGWHSLVSCAFVICRPRCM